MNFRCFGTNTDAKRLLGCAQFVVAWGIWLERSATIFFGSLLPLEFIWIK